MTKFEFSTPARIIFGPGTLREAGRLAKNFGARALVATGLTPRLTEPLLEVLRPQGVETVTFPVTGEPEISTVEQGLAQARQAGCQLVIGFGGGSAIDAAKAIAAMLANDGELLDYLEVIGRGQTLTHPSVPFLAIPTTAGTGAEVTRNAVLASPPHRVKVSLRGLGMVAKVALVDPELTYNLPPAVTASTGLDALAQLIEPYVCSRANPVTDALCVEGLRRAARSLRVAYADGHNAAAREDLAVASLFGGLALANAGLGAVHGFAAPIGGMFHAPHGAVCAALLAPVMETNLRALRQRQPGSPALGRYDEVARLLTGDPQAAAEQGAAWLRQLVADLRIPGLGVYGLGPAHIPELVGKAARASSMRPNPILLTPEELGRVLASAI